MTEAMRDDLIRTVSKMLGEGASIADVITHLDAVGVVRDATSSVYVVGSEFYRLIALPGERTAYDIEQELAVRYDLHEKHIAKLRLKYTAMRSARKEGRKKVATRAE